MSSSIASLVPLIAGSIFFALGINMILHFFKFRDKSTKISGRVTAIEKYISRRRDADGHRTSQVFFRPIVEFVYHGETRKTFGPSVNEVRHKLDQTVTVLVNADRDGGTIQTMLDDNMRIIAGSVFALIGISALLMYVLSAGGSPLVALAVAAVLGSVGYVISGMMLDFKAGFAGDADALPHNNSTLITTPEAFREEVSSHSFWGSVIAWSLMILSIGILYSGLNGLPPDASNMILTDFGVFWEKLTQGNIESSWEKPLIFTGMGLFFFLASLRSVYYMRKKYGGLLRR